MNPCPCGFFGDERRRCRCAPGQIERYRGRISGPLRDRIDLLVDVPAVPVGTVDDLQPGEPTAAVCARVSAARAAQLARYRTLGPRMNAELRAPAVARFCTPNPAGRTLLRTAVERLGLSARGYDRVLKVSRTIADLSGSEEISPAHVGEALQYRVGD